MKIVIGYPSLPKTDHLGVPLVSQNRQFQYFNEPTFIYPVVPAYAATMLKNAGHEVLWVDGPAEGLNWHECREKIAHFEPDLIAWEVKTPTVKRVWPLVDEIKKLLPYTKMVLMGDHITAEAMESVEHCNADYFLLGGDYDFGLLNIVNNKPKQKIIEQKTDTPLTELPIIDRELTKWRLYAYKNGNFKYLPGTYTYFGRDCWWRKDGGCTFCSWTNTFKNFRVVPVARAIAEIVECDRLGIREVFDDTGTFPVGKWLEEFCEALIKWKEKSGSKIRIGCNMRPGALDEKSYRLLGRAGFRFILYGLESANQITLDRINKGQRPGDMESTLKMAKAAGLEPHVTCMVGYPWETLEDARRTISFTRDLFRKGLIDTLQATIVIPYPGTALFREAKKERWLITEDWNRYDMREPVMHVDGKEWQVRALAQGIYKTCITPSFIARKVVGARSVDDFKFLWRAAKYVGGHLTDFAKKQPVTQ